MQLPQSLLRAHSYRFLIPYLLSTLFIFGATVKSQPQDKPFTFLMSGQRTVKDGTTAWATYYVLSEISRKCNNTVYLELIDREAFEKEIKRVLGVSLSDLAIVISEQTDSMANFEAQIAQANCDDEQIEQKLESLYDGFDITFGIFEGTEPLEKPLKTNAQVDEYNRQFRVDTPEKFKQFYAKAKTIWVGYISKLEDVKKEYRDKYYNLSSASEGDDYLYVVEKGWKVESAQLYKMADLSPLFTTYKFADEIKQIKSQVKAKLGIKFLFFSDETNNILATMPEADAQMAMKMLGTPEWEWINGALHKNPKG